MMGFDYTFSQEPLKLGVFDEKYGQTYWSNVNEHLQPVKFNSMNPAVSLTDKISAEERTEKKSAKGTDYFQLKKVKVVASDSPAHAAPVAVLGDSELKLQLDRIEAKLDRLMGPDEADEPDEPLPDYPEDM